MEEYSDRIDAQHVHFVIRYDYHNVHLLRKQRLRNESSCHHSMYGPVLSLTIVNKTLDQSYSLAHNIRHLSSPHHSRVQPSSRPRPVSHGSYLLYLPHHVGCIHGT